MSSRRNSLTPPERTHTEDPGAHELDSESDDHFSDAHSAPAESPKGSPVPRTRVEKVSDEPHYGEVPGTDAYRLREGDAQPDEIAFVNDGGSGDPSVAAANDDTGGSADGERPPDRPSTPGGKPIPRTVLEESADGDGAKSPAGGKKHDDDPQPDLVVKADGTLEGGTCDPANTSIPQPARNNSDSVSVQRKHSTSSTTSASEPRSPSPGVAAAPRATKEDEDEDDDADEANDADDDNDDNNDDNDDNNDDSNNNNGEDDFGDDFDDFEEGGADQEDFGDFDDQFQEPTPSTGDASAATIQPPPRPSSQQQQQQQKPPPPPLSFPIPDFDGLDADDVLHTTAPYLNGLYLSEDALAAALPPPPPLSNSIFLTPRSASLWSQLVAPPPLQPPDWIRSRIRRLFLVSLGVPVDLDEILPASKQKKLVLPSLAVHRDSPRTSTDSRGGPAGAGTNGGGGSGGPANNNSVARLKQSGANGSNSSVDSQGRPKDGGGGGGAARKRKGPPPPPELDLVAAQQLCATTEAALDGMTDTELQAHVRRLEALEGTAKDVLEYWTKRTDEKIGDREAFEGVIENLVAHARKTRK